MVQRKTHMDILQVNMYGTQEIHISFISILKTDLYQSKMNHVLFTYL